MSVRIGYLKNKPFCTATCSPPIAGAITATNVQRVGDFNVRTKATDLYEPTVERRPCSWPFSRA